MAHVYVRNLLFAFGFIAICAFYYWLHWTSTVPILGGDHAAYLLAADYFSPFGDRSREIMNAAKAYSYFPPLYPLVLGVAGATSAHVELAHAITITFLAAAFIWFFAWARYETRSALQSYLLVLIFVFLPTTFFQSFGILSETLYLWLTLVAIGFLSRADIPISRFYTVAVVIGLAAITRTAGIALIAAFAVYLLLHNVKPWLHLVSCSLVPIFCWHILKWLLGYQDGYLWIMTAFAKDKPLLDFLIGKLATESHGLWLGWITSFDHTPAMTSLIVGSTVGAICLAGTIRRAYLRKFDGIYLIFYLGMLMAWPSAPEARRFLFVVMPIFLVHGFHFVFYLVRRFLPVKPEAFGYIYLLIIALTVFPATGLIFQRLAMAVDESNWRYVRSLYWYSGENVYHVLDRNRLKIAAYDKYVSSWRKIADVVDERECVYSVHPTWLMLYADRPSYATPRAPTRDQFLQEATRCRYVYVASYLRSPYSVFYPNEYLGEGRVIFADRMEYMGGVPILGMLIEMPNQDQLRTGIK
jgi:hypothetical protein